MRLPSVMIVDDHRAIAEGLAQTLTGRFHVVGTITDARRVLDAASELQPEAILLDISMPFVSGFDLLRRLKQQTPAPKVIMLTVYADAMVAVEAFKAGASGYVLKASGEELFTAIDVVVRGERYLARDLRERAMALGWFNSGNA